MTPAPLQVGQAPSELPVGARGRARENLPTQIQQGLERETGLEPATFGSFEGLSVYALWHPSWKPERSVSSYRVVGARRWSPIRCGADESGRS